jgi:hypothetical protein
MKGRAQWPLRPRQLFFVLLTALLTAALSPTFVFATIANLPTDERRSAESGIPGSGSTSLRLLVRSAQILQSHQKYSPSHADRCCGRDRFAGERAMRHVGDVGIVVDGKILIPGRWTGPGVLRPS